MRFDLDHACSRDVPLVSSDVGIIVLTGGLVEHRLAHIDDSHAIGQGHIIVRAPAKQAGAKEQQDKFFHGHNGMGSRPSLSRAINHGQCGGTASGRADHIGDDDRISWP